MEHNEDFRGIRRLPSHLVQKAKNELNEVPAKLTKEIQRLRAAVKAVPNLNADLSDEFLLRFLRARKFNQDRVFKLIMKYYTIQSNNPSIFGDLLPSKSTELINANILSVLPYRDDQGRPILLFRSDRWDTSKFSLNSVTRAVLFVVETIMQDETVQVCGVVFIIDLQHFGISHLRCIRPGVVAKLVSLVQDAIPTRIKALHVVRETVLVDIAYTIFKAFLSSKLQKRTYFHGHDMSSLHRHIPPQYLPSDYDGLRGAIDYTYWPKVLFRNEELYQHILQHGFIVRQ